MHDGSTPGARGRSPCPRARAVDRFTRALNALGASVAVLLLVLLTACGDDLPDPIERDLAAIEEAGELRVLFTFNSTGYFVYRGATMGFEFDLLRRFAEENDLELTPVVVRDRTELFRMLNEGAGDVVAARLVETAADTASVAFTDGLHPTRPVLVQRTGPPARLRRPEVLDETRVGDPDEEDPVDPVPDSVERPRNLERVQVRARLVSRPAQLAGETLHVPQRFPFNERLLELSDSLGEEIIVVEVEDMASVEPLISRVAHGDLRLTVSPSALADLQEDYYRNITIRPVLGPQVETVWAVRRNAPELLTALNSFIEESRASGVMDELHARYFDDREGFRERVESEYLTSETGRLSEYDDLLRRHARNIGWDWRLLASQTYQESKFDPDARSWAGAMGLLQLMPPTARELGVAQPFDPEQNVAGAVEYLQWLEERWQEIPDPEQRLRFVLASYNAGLGHVGDARRLAEKNGDDPNVWEDVAFWLVQKSRREFYNDPVVKYGFCRGLEPVQYVALILERFAHYRNFVRPDEGTGEATDDAPAPAAAAT